MPVVVHCIRHGQGFHNLGGGNYELPDPKLTPMGEEQCLTLRDRYFPEQSHISLIAASALSRTIHTATLTFRSALDSKSAPRTILALPDAQETSDDPCDTGSDLEVLRTKCKENGWPVDLSLVKDGWNDKRIGGRYSPETKAIASRARDTRIFLRQKARDLVTAGQKDVDIVLVAHGGFLHYFTEDWEGSDTFPGTGWVNCEKRTYTFDHGIEANDEDAHVSETMESRRIRGLDYPMFPKAEQIDLFVRAMQGWEDQGLQNPSKIGLTPAEAKARKEYVVVMVQCTEYLSR